LKALIIGLGGVGQRHVRNLRALLGSDIEIIAHRVRRLSHVITPSLGVERARNVETEYDISVFETLESALEQKPQIAFVCNPTGLHVPTALACIEAGCDVFIEKPLSADVEGIFDLYDAVQRRQRIVMLGYQLRFHPCFLRLREILLQRTFGRPLVASVQVGEYLPGWHPYEDYRQMYASRAELGGGVILSQIHEFDYLYSLFGLPGRIFTLGGHVSPLEINVEDVASTLMEFRVDGRLVAVHLHQDYLQRPATRRCDVICETGKISMDLVNATVTSNDQHGTEIERRQWDGFDRNQLFVDELRHFLHCVETRKRPVVNLGDGILSLRMALSARESMASGRVVDLSAEPIYGNN
jgi:predicted dehydrogenase